MLKSNFLSRLTSHESDTTVGVVRPDKNYVFRRPKGQITLMRNLGLT